MLLYSRIFAAQLLVLSLIATAHIMAIGNDWYWHYVWLDVPVHFLAGVWVALVVSWLLLVIRQTRFSMLFVVASVLIVGISWEIFEVVGGISIDQPNYVFDTSLDVLMDVLGGLFGTALARRFLLPRV